MLGDLKTTLSCTFDAFNLDKNARRYLGGYCCRFNRRFSLAATKERIANAIYSGMRCTEKDLRDTEGYELSSKTMQTENRRAFLSTTTK